jgi:DNA replication and repair protein RecF
MSISRLRIRNLRNIECCELEPGPGMNLVLGGNGAGKTAVLEAVFLLARGRSFRESGPRPLVREGCETFEVFGNIQSEGEPAHRLGISGGRSERRIRLDGRDTARASALAGVLPVGILVPQSHGLIDRGPEQRRRLLDWGVFHVEPDYRRLAVEYSRALRQRNRALKEDPRQAVAWEAALAAGGEGLTRHRASYVEELNRALPHWSRALTGQVVRLSFRPGWASGSEGLGEALKRSRGRDLRAGYTGAGPHRADLGVLMDERPAQRYASRGQQKMVVASILLAQAAMIQSRRPGELVLLVDDFPAELDRQWRESLWDALEAAGCQVLLSATELELCPKRAARLFHVEQGRIAPEPS